MARYAAATARLSSPGHPKLKELGLQVPHFDTSRAERDMGMGGYISIRESVQDMAASLLAFKLVATLPGAPQSKL